MKNYFVPQDIYLKHEEEWKAIREASDDRVDFRKREKRGWTVDFQPTTPSGDGVNSAARN
jgi:hypothetical protein